ncbi:MAG: YceI family protein [Bacteroidota bacterium]
MKKIILLALILASGMASAQQKMICKTGVLTFEASIPGFEEVKATNNNVTVVINPKTGQIASLALMKGFRFKVALMEEHFNESYMQSDKYRKAVFKGKIEDFDVNNLTETPQDFIINGTLELHGRTQTIKIIAKISKSPKGIIFATDFSVKVTDFGIIITAVSYKVSNKVNISLDALLK